MGIELANLYGHICSTILHDRYGVMTRILHSMPVSRYPTLMEFGLTTAEPGLGLPVARVPSTQRRRGRRSNSLVCMKFPAGQQRHQRGVNSNFNRDCIVPGRSSRLAAIFSFTAAQLVLKTNESF
jgi:hypothetical protein